MTLKEVKNKIPKLMLFELCLIIIVAIAIGAYYVSNHIKANNQPPEIIIEQGNDEFSVNATQADFLAGVSAVDKEDGNVTESIIIESISQIYNKNTRNIVYVAFDSDNHVTKLEREIKYKDYKSPEFLNKRHIYVDSGEAKQILEQLKAEDVIDGDISNKIKLELNAVNRGVPGDYPVRATVTNSCGDVVTCDVLVTVTGKEVH